jgi:hypothetical protein
MCDSLARADQSQKKRVFFDVKKMPFWRDVFDFLKKNSVKSKSKATKSVSFDHVLESMKREPQSMIPF